MPFKSKAQQRKCYALKAKGQAGSWDCDEFSEHTDFEDLPEKVKKKASLGSLRHGGRTMSTIIARLGFAAGHQKQAGPISEYFGQFNPLSALGGNLIGAGTAAATPTRDIREQAEANQDMWKNLLIPGYASHNWFKRMGHGAWGPEMEEERRRIEREELDKEERSLRPRDDDEKEEEKEARYKQAGIGSEIAGSMLNPLNLVGGNILGAGAAALTPTRDRREQAEANQDFWKNLLIPGYAAHSGWKRMGHTAYGPEVEEEARKMRREELQGEMDRSRAESERRNPKRDEDEEEGRKAAGDIFARLGRASGYMAKAATYGAQMHGVQDYLPIMDKRELSETEKKRLEESKGNWFPKIFESYQTPLTEMVSSPGKNAILSGLMGGGFGALGGGALGGIVADANNANPFAGAGIGAGIGGLGLGGLAALLGYYNRKMENEDIEDLMGRLPENATLRDMMSDPVIQRNADRYALMMSGGPGGSGLGSGFVGGLAAGALDGI